jgi:hypothetical protein
MSIRSVSKGENMKVAKAMAIVIVVAIGAALVAASANAQQPTPAAPLNPNWCSDVPASPPPPYFEHSPGAWAAARKMCMNVEKNDMGCIYICGNAEDRWRLQKSGRLDQPNTFPTPTDELQGPFPLPGGASGYIQPLQPAPSVQTPDVFGPQSSVLSPGPISSGSFPGQELNAVISQPPDVSADVSPTQNAEFVNKLGLYVWNKPPLPVPSPAPSPTKVTNNVVFWCGSNGVNGQPLQGCVNGVETLGHFGDTQIGYDATLGRWIATQLAADGTSQVGYLYFAASTTNDAQGGLEPPVS